MLEKWRTTKRRSDLEYSVQPVAGKDGTFKVLVDCKRCNGAAFFRATWRGDSLRLLGKINPDGSEHTTIREPCSCNDGTDPGGFIDFDWTHGEDSGERLLFSARAISVVGIIAIFIFGIVYGMDGPMSGFGVLLAAMGPLSMAWMARKLSDDKWSDLSWGLIYAAIIWLAFLLLAAMRG